MKYLLMKGFLCVVISIQVVAITAAAAGASLPAEVHPVPAIYVFGDSSVDVGNNNYLPGPNNKVNFPHYGIDFPHSTPTGRFSNGYNIADFIAKFMGFQSSPPAYLSLTPWISPAIVEGMGGVNYASGGAGILEYSINAGRVIPLSKQVQYFAATKAQMEATLDAKTLHGLLSKSFFLISVGSNDVSGFASRNDSSNTDVANFYYNSFLSNYSATITALHKMGARKFGVINVGLIGCTPYARLGFSSRTCVESSNKLAKGFNDLLSAVMHDLSSKLEGLRYSIGDYYGLASQTLANPRAAGFVNTDSACCGGAHRSDLCLPTARLCRNRDHYVFWDLVHTTQRFSELGASAFYDGLPQYTTPINFKQLVVQQT